MGKASGYKPASMNRTDLPTPAAYGDNCAEFYDEIYRSIDPRLIDVLVQLADSGAALELGIGTGRAALPIRARGVDVSGIEASPAMLAKLRLKIEADELPVTKGNIADCILDGKFNLVFALVSTFLLLSSEEQQRCFHSVARMLGSRGVFLLENFGPSAARLPEWSNQLIATTSGVREYKARVSYAAPEQLDEMAACAGLRLRERWGDWSQRPYSPRDSLHISLYELS